MDPNLQFRFAMPGWSLALTIISLFWARGITLEQVIKLLGLSGQPNATLVAAVLAFAAAFLGAPAIGFILSTVVTSVFDAMGVGPMHSKVFEKFQERLENGFVNESDNDMLRHIEDTLPATQKKDTQGDKSQEESNERKTAKGPYRIDFDRKNIPAALVAYFEYRLHPETLLVWRRRQRTGFYANWTNILAIAIGLPVGCFYNQAPSICWPGIIVAIIAVLVAVMFGLVGKRGCELSDQELLYWVKSLQPQQAAKFLISHADRQIDEVCKDTRICDVSEHERSGNPELTPEEPAS